MVCLVPSPAGTPEGQVPAAATEPWGQEGLVQRGWAGGEPPGWWRDLQPRLAPPLCPAPPFDVQKAMVRRGAFLDPGPLAQASHKRLGGKRAIAALSRRQLSLSVRLCAKYVTLRSTHQPYDMHVCKLSLSVMSDFL